MPRTEPLAPVEDDLEQAVADLERGYQMIAIIWNSPTSAEFLWVAYGKIMLGGNDHVWQQFTYPEGIAGIGLDRLDRISMGEALEWIDQHRAAIVEARAAGRKWQEHPCDGLVDPPCGDDCASERRRNAGVDQVPS